MTAAGEGRDGGPRLVARPAPRVLPLASPRTGYGAGCAAAGAPREAFLHPFPSTERLIEINRQAAADAFSGYLPRTLLALAGSLAFATVVVTVYAALHELETRLAGCWPC